MTDFIDLDAIAGRLQELIAQEECAAKDFAERCEISPSTLSQVLNRKTKINVESINKIIRNVSSIDPMWLLFGEAMKRTEDSPHLPPMSNGESDDRYVALYQRLEEQAAEIGLLKMQNDQLKKSDIERIVIYRKDSKFATYKLSEDR